MTSANGRMLISSDAKTLGDVNLYATSFSSRNSRNSVSDWKLVDSDVEKRVSEPSSPLKVPEMSEEPIESVPVMSPASTCFTNSE